MAASTGAEDHPSGPGKAAASCGDEYAQECAGIAVVALDATPEAVGAGGGVEVAVRAEDDGQRFDQVTACREVVDEGARGAVVAQYPLELAGATVPAGADIHVVVGWPDEDAPGLVHTAAVFGDERIDKCPRRSVVP